MIFFFRTKKLVVDLFTTSVHAYEYAKPTLAKKWFPHWWKQLPKEYPVTAAVSHSTMKRCYGMTELYQHGFIVPMWADLAVEVSPIGAATAYRWDAATAVDVQVHSEEQRGTYLPDTHYQHLKLKNVWKAKSKDEVPFLMLQPTWNYLRPETVIVPPGILPIHIHGALHINMFIPRLTQQKTVMLELGQPLVQLVPLAERHLDLKTHFVDDKELQRLVPDTPCTFTNTFLNMKKAKQCPLHTGA